MAIRAKDKARDNARDKGQDKNKDKGRDKARATEGGIVQRSTTGIQRRVRETRSELKKVVWPTREAATNLTIIVVVVSAAVAAFLGAVDFVFKALFQALLGG